MAGLAAVKLNKEASSILTGMASLVGTAVALKGIDAFVDTISNKMETRKFNGVIDYAKKKHPELRKVPHSDLKQWMGAFHTLSPKLSVNKELGSTMLATVHDYGGNIDLATAKMIADTGSKIGGKSQSEVLGYLSAGNSYRPRSEGSGSPAAGKTVGQRMAGR